MTKIISLREPDGSVHYSHCYGEECPTNPGFELRPRLRFVHPTRPLRRTRLFGAAFGIAAAMFWGTMLTLPPTSEAALSSPESNARCIEAGRIVGTWFETELHRRAWASTSGYDNFNLMLAWFNTAMNQCTSGSVDRSAENFGAIE